MVTLAGLELPLDLAEFLDSQGEAVRRAHTREAAGRGLSRAVGLVSPTIVYDWFPVGYRDAKKAEVGGIIFTLGKHADLLEPAQSVFVALVTIGPRLETESRELQASGKALDSFMLDSAGVFAVGKLIETARSIVEKDAVERGWGVGAELAPGQLSGWAIAEQILIGRLLDIESVGVQVTDSGMLVPQKSASLMVGVGPGYESSEVRSPCEYCDVSETCHYRH
jgi:hypothetical protein